jgi:hypothetical protein
MNKKKDKVVNPDDWDHTAKLSYTNLDLDYNLTPWSIVELIQHYFSHVNKWWAKDNSELAKIFFAYPYPTIAVTEMGYDPNFSETETVAMLWQLNQQTP